MLRALIVEDEEMIRKGLVYTTDWLSMDCMIVTETADDQDGHEKILEHRPDMVMMDIYMPFMDGIEMIEKTSERARFKNILLTSCADFEYARRAIEARVCRYLLGPVDEEALADIMERLGKEIVSSRRVEHVVKQAGIGGGDLNLEYYMQLDLSENQYVSRAITTIREDFTRKLSIESISDNLGISTNYPSRKFKEVTGQAFLDFLNRYRVQQVIVILGIRQYRISEIPEATGFTGHRRFCSVFKKYTFRPPTKFIKGVS